MTWPSLGSAIFSFNCIICEFQLLSLWDEHWGMSNCEPSGSDSRRDPISSPSKYGRSNRGCIAITPSTTEKGLHIVHDVLGKGIMHPHSEDFVGVTGQLCEITVSQGSVGCPDPFRTTAQFLLVEDAMQGFQQHIWLGPRVILAELVFRLFSPPRSLYSFPSQRASRGFHFHSL